MFHAQAALGERVRSSSTKDTHEINTWSVGLVNVDVGIISNRYALLLVFTALSFSLSTDNVTVLFVVHEFASDFFESAVCGGAVSLSMALPFRLASASRQCSIP